MALDLHEQEQVAGMKAWWQSWGKYLFIILFIAVLTYVGYKAWQAYLGYQGRQASTLFIELEKNKDDPKKLLSASKAIIAQYPHSPYAPRAALVAAKANVDSNQPIEAQKQLEWIIGNAKETSLRDMAHLRLAALFLDAQQYDKALNQLKSPENETYTVQYQEMKGDILVELGKNKEAIEAYKQALAKVKEEATYRMILEVKLDAVENK